MGQLKSEFQEVISGEYGAIEDLRDAYHAAWDAHAALMEALPVRRTREQQRALDASYEAAAWAKWRYEQAQDWARIHATDHRHEA